MSRSPTPDNWPSEESWQRLREEMYGPDDPVEEPNVESILDGNVGSFGVCYFYL